MNRTELLKKIKKKAKEDEKNRKDQRFLDVLGFLVAKGFLHTNIKVPYFPNKRIQIADALWAGKNVEPRILEVLPAAVLRLPKHFDLDLEKHEELGTVVEELRKHRAKGSPFCGIEFEKIRVWADFPLKDTRVKTVTEKKITKTFRLKPEVLKRLKETAQKMECTETELLEKKLMEL